MTKRDVEKIISTGYIKPTGDDWYNIIVGAILCLGIYGSTAVVTLMKLGAVRPFIWSPLIVLLPIIVFAYWNDGKVNIVKTGLSKDENLALLRRLFKKLSWPTNELSNHVEIDDSKYILKFIKATIIYSDNYIGYNFQYTSTYKSGRPAFLVGIRTYLRSKFQRGLHEQLQSS